MHTNKFTERVFTFQNLSGISEKTMQEHLKLYSGYIKHANLILEKITEYGADPEKNTYAINEMQRRFGFEFNGIRNHEYFFEQLEGTPTGFNATSDLVKLITNTWGGFDLWLNRFKSMALTRGIGWAILYYDPKTKRLLNTWVDEQHIGQLVGLEVVLALDVWEHAYLYDYTPSQKKDYIDAFFQNLNAEKVEERFDTIIRTHSQTE